MIPHSLVRGRNFLQEEEILCPKEEIICQRKKLIVGRKIILDRGRKMFEIRNKMTRIPKNFGNTEEKCICGENESLSHIYICESLNQMKTKTSYDGIYNGNLKTLYKYLEEWKLA